MTPSEAEPLIITALVLRATELALQGHHARLAGDTEHGDELSDEAATLSELANRLGPSGDLMVAVAPF